jgi:hypothetical protein
MANPFYDEGERKVSLLSKDEEAMKKRHADVIHTITDSSRLTLTQQISNYFQMFSNFENNKAQWEEIENLFDQPIIIDSVENDYAQKANSLMDSFSNSLRKFNLFPRKWAPIARDIFEIERNAHLTYSDFRKGLRKLYKENLSDSKPMAAAEMEFLFNHIINAPHCYSSIFPDRDLEEEPTSCTAFTFKLAFQLHAASNKKRMGLNEIAFVIHKLSDFAADKAIILRCLTSSIAGTQKKGPAVDSYVSKQELGSVISILITDFSMYQVEKKNIKESAWLESYCGDLLDSDMMSIMSEYDEDGNSVAGGSDVSSPTCHRRSFSRGYRATKHSENYTRAVSSVKRELSKKLKASKEVYSLSKNKTLLLPMTSEEATSSSLSSETISLMNDNASLSDTRKAKKDAAREKADKERVAKEKEKEKLEQLVKTLKATQHVTKYKNQYMHIFDEMEAVSGEDLVFMRNNAQGLTKQYSSSNLIVGERSGKEELQSNNSSLPPLRERHSRGAGAGGTWSHPSADQVAYKKELLVAGAHNTEQQEKYFQSIITKFDYHIEKTLKRMTNLRGNSETKFK